MVNHSRDNIAHKCGPRVYPNRASSHPWIGLIFLLLSIFVVIATVIAIVVFVLAIFVFVLAIVVFVLAIVVLISSQFYTHA